MWIKVFLPLFFLSLPRKEEKCEEEEEEGGGAFMKTSLTVSLSRDGKMSGNKNAIKRLFLQRRLLLTPLAGVHFSSLLNFQGWLSTAGREQRRKRMLFYPFFPRAMQPTSHSRGIRLKGEMGGECCRNKIYDECLFPSFFFFFLPIFTPLLTP